MILKNMIILINWIFVFSYAFCFLLNTMENTVQAGTPAKVSKCDVEQDIEWPICNQCNSWLFRCGMDV